MRIVSLCPSLTETVFALGRGHELVGRTKFCVQPHGEVDTVERVGGTKNPRLERIVALQPDIVLMNEEENRKEDAAALRDEGVPVLATFARDLASAAESVVQIGDAIGATAEAVPIAEAIGEEAARVRRQSAKRARKTFAYLIWQRPWMAASWDTYISQLLTLAGGDNVVQDEARYPEVGAEVLSHAELILLSSEPFPFAESHRAEVAKETGLPLERLRLVDGELLSWHGVRTVAGLRYAEVLLG